MKKTLDRKVNDFVQTGQWELDRAVYAPQHLRDTELGLQNALVAMDFTDGKISALDYILAQGTIKGIERDLQDSEFPVDVITDASGFKAAYDTSAVRDMKRALKAIDDILIERYHVTIPDAPPLGLFDLPLSGGLHLMDTPNDGYVNGPNITTPLVEGLNNFVPPKDSVTYHRQFDVIQRSPDSLPPKMIEAKYDVPGAFEPIVDTEIFNPDERDDSYRPKENKEPLDDEEFPL